VQHGTPERRSLIVGIPLDGAGPSDVGAARAEAVRLAQPHQPSHACAQESTYANYLESGADASGAMLLQDVARFLGRLMPSLRGREVCGHGRTSCRAPVCGD